MILSNYSQLTRARQDLNIARAEGKALTALTQHYGFERPLFLPDNYWRECLKVLAYSAKGTPGGTFSFIEKLLDIWADSTRFTSTLSNGEIEAPEGTSFNCAYNQRMVRIYKENDEGYYQNYGVFFVKQATATTLTLSDLASSYWFGIDLEATGNIEVKVLPFFLEETQPGLVRVLIDREIVDFPAHYFLEDASTARDGNGYNTFFMDYFSTVSDERDSSIINPQRLGMFLGSDRVEGVFLETLEKILPAGVRAEIFAYSWCDESLNFNDVSLLSFTGRASGSISWPLVGSYDSQDPREDVS